MEKSIKLVVTAVLDSKVKQYSQPNVHRTLDEAIRSFGSACMQPDHDFVKFAGDFSFWHLGFYYPETGELEAITPHLISAASDFKKGVTNN